MAKQKETKFKEKIRPDLEAVPLSVWIKTKEKSLRGVPDFMACINGWAVVIELKTDEKNSKVDKLQEWRLRKWRFAGAKTYVLRPSNAEEVLAELHQLSKGGRHEI